MLEVGKVSEEIRQEEGESQEEIEQELNEEEIKELVKKASKEGQHEAMFILVLSKWHRPGGGFADYGKFEVLYGEIETTELENYYDYPTTNETVYAIIPKTRTVVLLHESGDDYQGEMQRHQKLYIFTYSTGWKSLDLD